jgi:hypothetical protein
MHTPDRSFRVIPVNMEGSQQVQASDMQHERTWCEWFTLQPLQPEKPWQTQPPPPLAPVWNQSPQAPGYYSYSVPENVQTWPPAYAQPSVNPRPPVNVPSLPPAGYGQPNFPPQPPAGYGQPTVPSLPAANYVQPNIPLRPPADYVQPMAPQLPSDEYEQPPPPGYQPPLPPTGYQPPPPPTGYQPPRPPAGYLPYNAFGRLPPPPYNPSAATR